jgi:hypothetical protein
VVIPAPLEVEIGGSWFKASWGKKLVRLYLKNNLGVVAHAIIPATWEAEVEGLRSKAGLVKNMRPFLKNKLKNITGLGCGSSGRVLA